MRIIAGLAKGRKLVTPQGFHTRPTADRVREALFSVLLPQLPGAKVLDAFAGSGALGLEALSRGAKLAHFIEKDTRCLEYLRHNVEHCCLPGAKIFSGDAIRFLRRSENKYDIIFLDPPYYTELLKQALTAILQGDTLAGDGLIVAEVAKKESFFIPDKFIKRKYSVYGNTALCYLAYVDPNDVGIL
ncbi:MAG: 16S rRNA (guanine(966)-N(2))-methyltransferase RsmD [Clostridiales bacterium]|nr:16S rRNA (guanine(966)-N(2))-methyltransferase RsmD [Clostridiales bacterium]